MGKIRLDPLYSSNSMEWRTPPELFEKLNNEFHFTLDSASTDENALCKNHFTKEQDALSQSWGGFTVFCNPPYGRQIKKWVQKGYEESLKPNTKVVMLIPCRPDTSYFHDYILGKASEVRLIRSRIQFIKPETDHRDNAPFPSMIVIFDKETKNTKFIGCDWRE